MDFEIEYNPESLKEIAQLRWELEWKRHRERTYIYLIPGVFLTAFGIYILPHGFGYIVLIGGLTLTLFALWFLIYYSSQKRAYFKKMDSLPEKHDLLKNRICFMEDYLIVEDVEMELKLKWNAVEEYHVMDDILFLRIGSYKHDSIIIRSKDIGRDRFAEVIAFVKRKLRKNKPG